MHIPCTVDAARLRLIQPWLFALAIKAHNKRADTERPSTTGLCVALLDASNVLCDVFDGYGIFDCETVGLGFDAGRVDEDTSISVETCECKCNMVVQQADL